MATEDAMKASERAAREILSKFGEVHGHWVIAVEEIIERHADERVTELEQALAALRGLFEWHEGTCPGWALTDVSKIGDAVKKAEELLERQKESR